LNYIRVETDKTVSAILKDLQVNQNYGLVQVHRDAANSTIGLGCLILTHSLTHFIVEIIGRDILSGSDLIGKVAEGIDLEVESPDLADLWLVDLSMEVGVFFNTYFRMVTGTPAHLLRLYVQPGMTVGDFEAAIKRALFIRDGDERFGLYGFADNEVVRLDPGLMMTELRERNAEPASKGSYFQFQMHAECETQGHLGIARASNLQMRVNRGLRKTKKCWFALQGTSIFYRPGVRDHSDVREIPNVDECKVIYRGEQKKGQFRFDLVPREGPVRVFTSPLKRRVIRWVRELRRCHRTLTINDPVTMGEVLKMRGVSVSPNSALTRSKNAAIRSLGFYQRRAIEAAEAHLQAVELDGGLILHNGIRWPGSFETGMNWVEDIRRLVLHMAKVEATVTASENVTLIHELLRKTKGWVAFFEDGPRALKQQEEPDIGSIREIVEAAQYLVNCYRMYHVKLGSGADDELQSESERRILEEMLDNLQLALADSIFEAKPVRRYIVRGAFKEERPPTPPPAAEAKRKDRKAARATAVQGAQEAASQSMTHLNNSLSAAGMIGRSGFEAGTAAQLAPETFPDAAGILSSAPMNGRPDKTALLRAANAEHFDEDEEVDRSRPGKMAWLKGKLSAFFQRPDFRHKRLEDEVEEDDVSFTVSFVSDPDRAQDQKWADAKDLFRSKKDKSRSPRKSHSSKKNSERASSPLAAAAAAAVREEDEAGPAPVSGFNGFGTKPAKKSRSKKTPKEEAAVANPWGVPDAQEEKPRSAAPSDEASSKRRSRRRASENLGASQPAPAEPGSPIFNKRMSMPDRTGPEEEAEMLRMLKDPKIRSRLLAEMKEDRMPALQEPEANDAARGWGKGRRERVAQA
jgi:hypothetical protein